MRKVDVRKRRHHFVPITYLNGFTASDGFLFVARKDEPDQTLRVRPGETAFRSYYYSQPLVDGSMNHNALEDAFSSFETKWPHIVRTLDSGVDLNSVLGDLHAMIGFQRVRVPAFRDAIEQSLHRIAQAGFEELKHSNLLPIAPRELPNIADLVEVTIDPHRSIHGMTELLKAHGPIFETLGYQLLRNETDVDFITSDNPVSFYTMRGEEVVPYIVHPKSRSELFFPVTSRLAIVGAALDRKRYARKGLKSSVVRDAEKIRMFNRRTAKFGYEALFSSVKLPSIFVKKHQLSPVLSSDSPAFGPDNIKMPQFAFGTRRKLLKWRN